MPALMARVGGAWVPLGGPQGPKGDTGAQGPAGPTGPQGPPGVVRLQYVACPTSDQAGFGATPSDIQGSIVSWGAVAGHWYRLSYQFVVLGTAIAYINLYIVDGAAKQYLRTIDTMAYAGGYMTLRGDVILSGLPAGAIALKAQINFTSGSGTVLTGSGSHMLVEDLGL